MIFTELGLHDSIANRCETLGYETPTPIQRQAIPVILTGVDMIGCAATGTGKTAAFLLPMLQKLYTEEPRKGKAAKAVRCLILVPTRELAIQIADHLKILDRKKLARSVTVVGGASSSRQRSELFAGVPIVIATPGRLMDHLENRNIDLSSVETLVLDEADRMLDMGFLPAIRRIFSHIPEKRQTLLFSATMLPAIEELARTKMQKPQIIEVNKRGKAAITIEQKAYPVALESKTNLLLHLLENERYDRVLVFTRTRRGAERLSHLLTLRKHQVSRIHADRSQPQREAALRGFKNGNYRVLVATDIAARGIDVDSITHVINFDMPDVAEDYVHRIGRTGRAGNSGQAISLVAPIDEITLSQIEKLMGQAVERIIVPGFGGTNITKKPIVQMNKKMSFGTRSFGARRGGRR